MSLCSQMTKSGFALQNIMDFMRSLRLSSCCCGLLCRSNEFGTPYLKAMYQFAMDHFESDFYGYVNADILLDSTIISSLQQIQKEIEAGTIENRVYAVGQRTNVQQEPEDKYEKGGSESAEAFVLRMLLKGHRYWDSAVVIVDRLSNIKGLSHRNENYI